MSVIPLPPWRGKVRMGENLSVVSSPLSTLTPTLPIQGEKKRGRGCSDPPYSGA
jgi:hypothetical protein